MESNDRHLGRGGNLDVFLEKMHKDWSKGGGGGEGRHHTFMASLWRMRKDRET